MLVLWLCLDKECPCRWTQSVGVARLATKHVAFQKDISNPIIFVLLLILLLQCDALLLKKIGVLLSALSASSIVVSP